MSDGDFVTVPVADVGASWLLELFLPAVDVALMENRGCVYRLTTDSAEETDYLLARVAERGRGTGRRVRSYALGAADPILDWAKLFGPLEGPIRVSETEPGEVVLLSGGDFLPSWFVRDRIRPLRVFAFGAGALFVIPLSRPVSREVPFESGDRELAVVPSIAGANRERLRSLIDWLLQSECPELRDDSERSRSKLRGELADRLAQAAPESRAQVREWIQHYVASVKLGRFPDLPGAIRASAPPVMGGIRQRLPVASRESLHSRFVAATHRVFELNERFLQLMHRALFRRWERPRDPFMSDDPVYWFEGVVSYLSCLLFDAGKNGLLVVTKFQIESTTGDIVGETASELPETLRVLRTLLQHGLNCEDANDRRTILAAAAWFQRVSGTPRPTPNHFRVLTQRLIGDWESLLVRVSELIDRIPDAPGVQVLINELDRSERSMPRIDLFRIADDVIKRLGVEQSLDSEQFLRTHEETLRRELADSCVPVGNLRDLAADRIERRVAEELSKCPIRAKWLIDRGVKGPDIGKLLRRFEDEWAAATGTRRAHCASTVWGLVKRGRIR